MIHRPDRKTTYLLLLLTCTLMTWFSGVSQSNHIAIEPLMFENGFPGDSATWELSGDHHNLEILADQLIYTPEEQALASAKKSMALPPRKDQPSFARASLKITALQRRQMDKDGRQATFKVRFKDENGKNIKGNQILRFDGTQSVYETERILTIPGHARFISAEFRSGSLRSDVSVTNVAVELVDQSLLYKVTRILLTLSWTALLGFLLYWTASLTSLNAAFSIMASVSFVLIGVLLPENLTAGYIRPAYRILATNYDWFRILTLQNYFDIGHCLFFCLLTTVSLLVLHKRLSVAGVILPTISLMAIASEGMQLHLTHRSARMFDLAIDFAGIVLGVLIYLMLRKHLTKESKSQIPLTST